MKYENEIREVYDNLSKRYHEITADHFFNTYLEVPATMSLLKNIKGKKVLDLGCGTGRHSVVLKKRDAKIWGLDLSPKMIEIAKSKVKNVDFRVGTVYKLPFKSNFFDIVLAGLCISYFKDLDKAFKEINRVLKKKGIFVFSSTNPLIEVSKHIKGKSRDYRKFGEYFRETKMYANWPTFKARIPFYHKTFQTLIRAIIRNGFIIEDYLDERPVKKIKKIDPERYRIYSMIIPHYYAFKVRKK
jgi:ubiquinone/menaquinone biosynthesis C-methylase UbiE